LNDTQKDRARVIKNMEKTGLKKPSKRDKGILFTDKGVTYHLVPVEDPVILEKLRQLDEEKEEGEDLILEELNRQLEEGSARGGLSI